MVAQAAQRFDAEGRLTHEPTREAVARHLASFVAFARR
jgi:hypothetical protein